MKTPPSLDTMIRAVGGVGGSSRTAAAAPAMVPGGTNSTGERDPMSG